MSKNKTFRDPLILEMLERGVQLHRSGDLSGAAAAYHDVLARAPDNPDALHLFGLAAHQLGKHDLAVEYIERAIRTNSAVPNFFNNCGDAYRALGQLDLAAARYRRALALDRHYAEAHNNLGIVLRGQGQLNEAIKHFKRALSAKGNFGGACLNLACALYERGHPDAVKYLELAVSLDGESVELLELLGNALIRAGRADDALEKYERALGLLPDAPTVWANKAIALIALSRFSEAEACLKAAIIRAPGDARINSCMGAALHGQDRLEEAEACLRKAAGLDPANTEARRNLAIVLRDQGRLNQAIDEFERLLELAPEDADTHFALGFALLLGGNWESGWEEYEWRWKTNDPFSPRRTFKRPLWDGSKVAGKTILIHAEQGAGDVIQFIRFVPAVAKLGAKVVMECSASIAPLVAGVAGVSETIISGSKLPQFDLQCPLASLPRILRTRLATIPREVPYLVPNSEKIAAWQSRLASESSGLRVGIAWTGSKLHANNRKRSCQPSEFLPFIRPGLTLYSLQKEHDDTDELSRLGLVDHTAELRDFSDTAALISCLDMVISVDTSVAHLAGALGKPTWLLLPYAPDWRWLLEREDSPWYPTMRLFRQPRPGAWRAVVAAVSAMIGEMVPAQSEAAPVSLTRGTF